MAGTTEQHELSDSRECPRLSIYLVPLGAAVRVRVGLGGLQLVLVR